MRTRHRVIALGLTLAGLAAGPRAASTPPATSLRVRFHGPSGETVRIDTATMLIGFWGGGEAVPLTPGGSDVLVDLSAGWVQSRFPGPGSTNGARLFVSADGYAPILSNTFPWLGVRSPAGSTATTETTVGMGGQSITMRTGDEREMDVALRRPVPRRVRVVDQAGRPAAGIVFNVYMFWTRANHCGVFEGTPLLRGAVTDARGQMAVPDGDFDYGLDLPNGAGDAVFDDEPVFYQRVVTLSGPETTVTVRRFDRRTVALQVLDPDDAPVGGAQLIGDDHYTGCMDPGIRPLGATDAAGRLTLTHFPVDEFDDLVVCRAGKEAWRGGAVATLSREAVQIRLAPAYVPADPSAMPCRR
jgi:hypothetical protein